VRGLISIANDLGMTVTAEGIENECQRAELQRLGCDRGQGYYFAPPLPVDELEALLRGERVLGAASAGTGAHADPRVLIVDDDQHILQLTSFALEMDGYDVSTAADGMSALDHLRQRPPNVIVLDMMMPIMDGWRFSEAYHELPGPHAPIVVLTAAADAAGCAAQVGAARYLSKPFDVDALLTIVDQLAPAHAS
jgi:CheY-like chemotaxis protein